MYFTPYMLYISQAPAICKALIWGRFFWKGPHGSEGTGITQELDQQPRSWPGLKSCPTGNTANSLAQDSGFRTGDAGREKSLGST